MSLGQPDQIPKPDLNQLQGKTVLIVDDEADIRSLVARMLKGRGVDSITTDSADRAVEILNEHADQIAVVLLDLSVPNTSDVPAIDRLRQEHPATPVIIMSGMAHGESEVRQSGDTLIGYLRKPFRPAALYDALSQRGKMADPPRGRSRQDSGGRTSDQTRVQST